MSRRFVPQINDQTIEKYFDRPLCTERLYTCHNSDKDLSASIHRLRADPVKISDVTCAHCGALYLLAESASVEGSLVDGAASDETCKVCGKTFADRSDGKLRAFRFVMSPAAHPTRAPLSPAVSP